jgi:hypothetical protein
MNTDPQPCYIDFGFKRLTWKRLCYVKIKPQTYYWQFVTVHKKQKNAPQVSSETHYQRQCQ